MFMLRTLTRRRFFSGVTLMKLKLENGVWIIPAANAKFPIRHISVGGELRLACRWPKCGEFTIAGLRKRWIR